MTLSADVDMDNSSFSWPEQFDPRIEAANLNYLASLLIQISHYFNISLDETNNVGTLEIIGLGIGVVFIAPLGDLVPRRQLILGLALCATVLLL